jgi:hypothetical protein
MKRVFSIAIIALMIAGGAFAQATLTKSSSLPSIDGVIGPSEYQYSGTDRGITLYATLGSDDTLYLAVEAPTSGWVAVGLGGLVMNGSRLFLGATQDGKPAFLEKTGIGHFYTDAKNPIVKNWAVKTAGENTVLELSLPASAVLANGQIKAIFAYAKVPNFTTRHAAHASITFTVN